MSVNPQTFNDKTLEIIGRKHKSADTYNAYMLVKDKFDVNMDLIACLPGETIDDFKRSVDIAVALNPANVTVHTLYMKKALRSNRRATTTPTSKPRRNGGLRLSKTDFGRV